MTTNKSAINSNLPVLDDLNHAWDSGAAIKRVKDWASNSDGEIDFSKYRKAFFWVDSSGGDKQGDYKLPFADVIDGELKAVWRGCAAAMGALLGAQGGVDLPDSDRKPVYNAISKYYDKFGKDAPEFKSEEETERKEIFAEVTEKDMNEFTAIASTGTEDRQGEVVDPTGWQLDNFKKNPVLLWAHDHTIPAIGRATDIAVRNKQLVFKGVWQTVTDEGRAAAQLVKDGIIKTFSVGFLPTEREGKTYTKQELLEISLVNVPANPDAMMLAYKSLKDGGFKKKTIENLGIPVKVLDKLDNLDKSVNELTVKVENLAKEQKSSASKAPEHKARQRQTLIKAIAKSSDLILVDQKLGVESDRQKRLAKIIKRAGDMLASSHKETL